jgi:hypothetical protein
MEKQSRTQLAKDGLVLLRQPPQRAAEVVACNSAGPELTSVEWKGCDQRSPALWMAAEYEMWSFSYALPPSHGSPAHTMVPSLCNCWVLCQELSSLSGILRLF